MPNKIEIVDKHNLQTGKVATINQALAKGSWHRGIHVVICSRTGYVVLQKRSKRMITHPGLLDFSVGGFVDAGEDPETAAVREVKEEVGLSITPADLHFLRIHRYNHRWPRLHKKNRAFIYVYLVCLPDARLHLCKQPEEVEWVRFVPYTDVKELVRRHHLKGLGRLEPTYWFYAELVQDIHKFLQPSPSLVATQHFAESTVDAD